MTSMSAIGLMSGTSLDGVDVALLNTDGERIEQFGPTGYRAYSDDDRVLLRHALGAAANLPDRTTRSRILTEVEGMITRVHADAVETFLAANGIAAADIRVIGFHGQTVLHRPERRVTVQLGDAQALASQLGIPVVSDLRVADVEAGGQGAPIVPVYHQALVRMLDVPQPVCVVNIGGVANVTFIDGDAAPVACDTGPGNALLDDFMRLRTGQFQDRDGATAAAGRVDADAVARVLAHPYFRQAPPKSLDRNDFRGWVADHGGLVECPVADGAATLTAITAASIARVVDVLPKPPKTWIVAGGGAHNPTLMRMLAERVAPATVTTADSVGWSVDALEAQAFAFLAVRSLRGLPLTFPGTTGVAAPMTGGVLVKPA